MVNPNDPGMNEIPASSGLPMPDVRGLLREVCGDDAAGDEGVDLIESGLLDSLALIELFSRLEEQGIELQPTRIDRSKLRTAEGIEEIVREWLEASGQQNELGMRNEIQNSE